VKNEASISLARAHSVLGWPTPADVKVPQGEGASIFASLAREKIGRALARFSDGCNAVVGVLHSDPQTHHTEPPIAVLVDFPQDASETTLRELHRLAWNFSHSPILITLEPNMMKVWTCCEAPDADRTLTDFLVHQICPADLDGDCEHAMENDAARALHWINLVSGEFVAQHASRFDRDGRADQMLLGNLRHIRSKLRDLGLTDDDVCHDLLARVIFVQFLFDRKDQDGMAALTPAKLARLHADGILLKRHDGFNDVLSDYADTYRLFEWLNTRFNGDLFPGKGDTPAARANGWTAEKRIVTRQHLALLADFIRGMVEMPTGQRCLWPLYSFDVIPLEFISSIYETFVTERAAKDGIFYTPPYLVDFVLDRVLPWGGGDWNLKILDPACGSGIFLVKAFQRLVHRWKKANPNQNIRAETLRSLLERNIFGVDKDPHAVRVACFSLYLAMCDEIEPRHYWTQIVFPSMRGRRLICSDFFEDGLRGFDTLEDAASYDLIVGNAPWGAGVVTSVAINWARADARGWFIPNKDIGSLFLVKAAHLVAPKGKIAMIQSANSLLFNVGKKAGPFRKKLFATYSVDEIYNLSALRFKVFKGKSHTTKTSIAPACVVIMGGGPPVEDGRISYVSPKHLKPVVDEFSIIIEPHDRRSLSVHEAVNDDAIWATLMWGHARDKALLSKLRMFSTLLSPGNGVTVKSRQGINYGDRSRPAPQLRNYRLFDSTSFPADSFLHLDTDALPLAGDISTHSRDSTDFSAFAWPQLIIKQSWQKSAGRFQARLSRSTAQHVALCNQSYLTINTAKPVLEAACLSFNSLVAVYFLQLTSGSVAAYRPKALVPQLLGLPLPPPAPGMTEGLDNYEDLDNRVFEAFGLKDAERALIEDMVAYTLADFHGDDDSVGRQATSPGLFDTDESHLRAYCDYVMRVLKAGFGFGRPITATIFQTPARALPFRLVAFELGGDRDGEIKVAGIKTAALLEEMERLDGTLVPPGKSRRGIYHQRVARIYAGQRGVPKIFVVKPDMAMYWTRTTGLCDGDEIALDLFRWQQARQKKAVLP
jgi:hypothetical protein